MKIGMTHTIEKLVYCGGLNLLFMSFDICFVNWPMIYIAKYENGLC